MDIRRLATFDDVGLIVKAHFKEKWIFRGVDDEQYGLRPKIGREGARKDPANGTHVPYAEHEEQRLLYQYIREALPLVPIQPKSEMEWVAVAQHHGMPTRLLDWSESPLVALYFAVSASGLPEGPGRDKRNAALYGVKPPPHMHGTGIFTTGPNDPSLLRPPHLSPRITTQRGLFTLHNQPDKDWKPDDLIKWIVPAEQCFTLKRMLDFCGINEASLFPDLVGIAQHLGFRYKWGGLDSLN